MDFITFNPLFDEQLETQNPAYHLPYDKAPFHSCLEPGQSIKLHGWIEVSNASKEIVRIRAEFRLSQGFYLEVLSSSGQPLVSDYVQIQRHYIINNNNGTWEIEEII
jgi:hypothetical protein